MNERLRFSEYTSISHKTKRKGDRESFEESYTMFLARERSLSVPLLLPPSIPIDQSVSSSFYTPASLSISSSRIEEERETTLCVFVTLFLPA